MVYSKNYFNLAKEFVLRQFKMATNQTECPKFELWSNIKFFMAKKCKLYKIYRRMCNVEGEAYFNLKMFRNGQHYLKKAEISIMIKHSFGRDTTGNKPEMVESVNVRILADRRVTTEDIFEQLLIYVGTVHKIMHDDLAFFKVSGCWILP